MFCGLLLFYCLDFLCFSVEICEGIHRGTCELRKIEYFEKRKFCSVCIRLKKYEVWESVQSISIMDWKWFNCPIAFIIAIPSSLWKSYLRQFSWSLKIRQKLLKSSSSNRRSFLQTWKEFTFFNLYYNCTSDPEILG